MGNRGLFGGASVGAISVVDAPVSLAYARKARIAFVAVAVTLWAAVAAAVAVFEPLWLAVLVGLLVGFVAGLLVAIVVRIWPVLRVLWWWSFEITLFTAVVLGPAYLSHATSAWLALAVIAAVAVICTSVGPVRRFLYAWAWCAIVRHRLRLCFAEFIRSGSRSRPGRLPLVLWARPTPAGERVWLWLRPGLDLAELDGKTGELAVACWAGEARVVRASSRFAALIRVDVAHRDPLTGRVSSPLAGWIPKPRKPVDATGDDLDRVYLDPDAVDAPVSPVVGRLGLDLADVPEPPPDPPRGGARR